MEIHQLRYLCAVAETGSFTRGARLEHVTQPTLSQQISKLEAEVGARLFDRLKDNVRLTDAGRALLHKAKAILSLTDEAALEVKRLRKCEQGSVRVGAIPTVAPYLLPPVLKHFRQHFPSIEIRVIEDTQARILPSLREGVIDLALIHRPRQEVQLRMGHICRQSIYAAVHEDHPLAAQHTARLAHFRNDDFLLLREGFQFRTAIADAFRAARIRPNVVFESLSFTNLLAMVAAGAGVSLIPEVALEKRRGCKFLAIEELKNAHEICWAVLRRHVLSPAQKLFLDALGNGAVPRRRAAKTSGGSMRSANSGRSQR